MRRTTLTGKALLASVLSLTLCFTMLLGTTFAWFTDKVTTGANQIISGDLEVALLDKDGNSLENSTTLFQDKNGNTSNLLWEPGATFKTVDMFVKNDGNLALKYKLILNITGEDAAKLLEVVTVTVTMGGETVDIADFEGKLMPGYQSEAIVVQTHMDQSADKEYEGLKAALSLTVLATQLDAEFDSLGNDYDADAGYPASGSANVPAGTTEPTTIQAGDVSVTLPAGVAEGEYGVDVSAVTSKTDDAGNTTLAMDIALKKDGVKVTADGTTVYTVSVNIGKNLAVSAVTHNGSAVDHFSYDPTTGLVTFETDSFSPFTVTYAEADGDSVFVPADPDAAQKLEKAEVVAVDENGNEYTSITDAVKSGASKIYCKAGADLGTVTHLNVVNDLVIYGNGARLTGGNRDLALNDQIKYDKDITVTVYNLHGVGYWGSTSNGHTLNLSLYNCEDVCEVYINGTSGVNNIALYGCTYNIDTLVGDTAVYSNANGSVIVDGCTFNGIPCSVNLNHKIAGEQTVTVTNSTFVDCATEGTEAYFAPIRLYNSAEGANQTLTVAGNTFTYSEGKAPINKADVLLNAKHNGVDAAGTIVADVQADATVASGANVELSWTVTNAKELYAVAAYVNQFSDYQHYYDGETVKLMNDIDLGGAEWTPIGDYRYSANRFCGTFDGQDHTISNFKISKKTDKNDENKSAYGFFGNLTGVVKRLTLDNVTIDANVKFAGVLAGRFTGCTHGEDSELRIENCKVTNSSVTIKNWTAGGLVGQWNEGEIVGCTVENTTVTGYAAVGAIAGVALNANDHLAENCTVKKCDLVQNGSYGEGWDDMFAAIVGSIHSETVRVTMNGCSVEDMTVKGEESSALYGYIEVGATLTVDGVPYVTTAEALSAAIKNGGTVALATDIAMSESVALSKADFVLDGNGYTITMAEGATNEYALLDINGGKATVQNVTFDGIKGGAVIRTTGGVELNVDKVTVQNCAITQVQGLLRLLGKSTITNSTFKNNTCNMVISLNYDGANNDPQVVQNCVFEGNTAGDVAVVYYVKGAGATIDGNKFLNNTVKASAANGNGATLYMGFTENNVITNNVFDGNTVTTHNASKRVAGAVMLGYATTLTGNCFVNNTATAEDGHVVANDVCASVYYSDIDLSGNYWGGSAPVENDDYFVEYPDNNKVIINDYLTTYGE